MFTSEGVFIQLVYVGHKVFKFSQKTNTVFVYYLFSADKFQYNFNNLWKHSPRKSLEKNKRQLERHNKFFFQKTLSHQAQFK